MTIDRRKSVVKYFAHHDWEDPMRLIALIALLNLVAVVQGDGDEAPVTIQIKMPGTGERVKRSVTKTSTSKTTTPLIATAEEQRVARRFVFVEDVLAVATGSSRPTKLERKYDVAEVVKDGDDQTIELAGKAVVIEQKNDKFTFTIGGKPISGLAVEILDAEFNSRLESPIEESLPKNAVKVGEKWKIGLISLSRVLAPVVEFDEAKSSASGKLVRVYTKANARYGVIEFAMELVPSKTQDVELSPDSKVTVITTIDGCIDGTASIYTKKMTLTGDLTGSIMGSDMTLKRRTTTESTCEELKK